MRWLVGLLFAVAALVPSAKPQTPSSLTILQQSAVLDWMFHDQRIPRSSDHLQVAIDAETTSLIVLNTNWIKPGEAFAIGQREMFLVTSIPNSYTLVVQRGYMSNKKTHQRGAILVKLKYNSINAAAASLTPTQLGAIVEKFVSVPRVLPPPK